MNKDIIKGGLHESRFWRFVYSDFAFILCFGLAFICVATPARALFTKRAFIIESEIISLVVPIYVAIDVAILSLSPVFVGLVRTRVKTSLSRKKRRLLGHAFDGMLDSFCVGTIVWSSILIVACVVNLTFRDSVMFAYISSFELAILLVFTLSICMMLHSTWPETFANNTLKRA